MKKIQRLAAYLLSALMLSGCAGNGVKDPVTTEHMQGEAVTPVAESLIGNPLIGDREKLMQLDYGDVSLGDGLFQQVYDNCMAYYDAITADDILWRLRKHAGLDVGSGRDLGWESGTTNAECCLSQLISAKARRYAVTGKQEDLQTVQDILTGYQEVIDAYGGYPLMYSAYFYEKNIACLY